MIQGTDIGYYEHFSKYFNPILAGVPFLPPIVRTDIYIEIEKKRSEELISSELDPDESIWLESLHIKSKMVFDSINESLIQFRPYGKEGIPMPWTKRLRRLRWDEVFSSNESIFEIVKTDLVWWNSMKVGVLPQKRFLNEFGVFDEAEF